MKIRFFFKIILLFSMPTIGYAAQKPTVAQQASMLVSTALKYHYAPRPLDSAFSQSVFKNFLQLLDPHGLLFTKEVVQHFEGYKNVLIDQIIWKRTAFLDSITRVYGQQLLLADSLIGDISKRSMEFSPTDTFWLEGGDSFVQKNRLRARWEDWIKYMIVWLHYSEKDSLSPVTTPSGEEIRKYLSEAISRETCRIRKKLDQPGTIQKITRLQYLKAIALAFDPHTEYMSLEEKNDFEAALSNESASFGMRFKFNKFWELEVEEVAPAGPAWRSGKINEGDVVQRITKLDTVSLDIQCASLADVYGFLLSTENKPAVFQVRKKNGSIVTVSLKKEILDVEENTIRSYILKDDAVIGYVYLPSFYSDFTYGEFFSKGCAADLARELVKLKNNSIQGLILDLRSDGGGSLWEAIRVAGLFIDFGAICITDYRGGKPEVIKDLARGTMYGGLLIILVNSSSASASELLTGVLQDYNRALVVGSNTYGKSTIQEIMPVDAGNFDSLSHYKGQPPGFVKMTIGAFYRVTGASHQKTGIVPDIELPQLSEPGLSREALLENPLELKGVDKKTYYVPGPAMAVPALNKKSQARVKENRAFKYMTKAKGFVPKAKMKYGIPLAFRAFAEYMNRMESLDDSLSDRQCPYSIKLTEYKNSTSPMNSAEKAENEMVMRDLRKDLYVHEAAAIMHDLIKNTPRKEEKQ